MHVMPCKVRTARASCVRVVRMRVLSCCGVLSRRNRILHRQPVVGSRWGQVDSLLIVLKRGISKEYVET